jgi:hydroxyacylglutathione hydrolase
MLDVTLIPILEDNYCYLIQSGKDVGLFDVGDAKPVIDYLEKHGIQPTHLFTTHHHWDHTEGIEEIKRQYNLHHIAAEKDKHRISDIDQTATEGDIIQFGDETFQVIETHGHTINHIVFYGQNSKTLFSGDTLFAMGCGRLFEGTHEQMFESLQKLKTLPDETNIYCGHEYTLTNAKFSVSAEPGNKDIQNRLEEVEKLREDNNPTIPTTIGLEKRTNLFLMSENIESFKHYRDLRDQF